MAKRRYDAEQNSTPDARNPVLYQSFHHHCATIIMVDVRACSYWAPAYLNSTPDNQALYPRGAAAIGSSPAL